MTKSFPQENSKKALVPMKWPYQAEDLRIDTLNYIHQTDDIKNFLNGEGIFFVCGLEGMGKSIIHQITS